MKKKRKRVAEQTQKIEIDGNKIRVSRSKGGTNIVYTDKQKGITVISSGGDVILSK